MRIKLITVVTLAVFCCIAAYSEVMPSKRYDLSKEENSKLSRVLSDAGHTQEMAKIAASKYESGNIIINVELEPLPKKKYKEMTRLGVDYTEGKMKISYVTRMICYDSTDFYFEVDSRVADEVIDKTVERYLSIIKHKEFGFIKLGKIRCLYQREDSYVLSIVIPEDTRYAFTLILDKKDPSNFSRIEIEPLPIL